MYVAPLGLRVVPLTLHPSWVTVKEKLATWNPGGETRACFSHPGISLRSRRFQKLTVAKETKLGGSGKKYATMKLGGSAKNKEQREGLR